MYGGSEDPYLCGWDCSADVTGLSHQVVIVVLPVDETDDAGYIPACLLSGGCCCAY